MNEAQSSAFEAFRNPATAARFHAAYDALLIKWPVPYKSVQLSTPLGLTHVIISGPADAPPLVLLHGMSATALVWKFNARELSQHYRVYAVDVIGQNGKSISSRRIRTRRDYADWLCAVFDALGIKQASLAGNSYGAFLALSQASLAPERVSRVVLINPAGIFVSLWPFVLQLARSVLLEALRLKPRSSFDIASNLGRDVRLRPDEQEWADLINIKGRPGKETWPNLIFPTVFSTAELRAIRQRVLLLMGDNDLIYDPRAMAKIAKTRMPALEVAFLEGAHHIAAMSQPAEANREIIGFLQQDLPDGALGQQ